MLLDEQDRTQWNREQIAPGLALVAEAREAYRQALDLARQGPERRFLERRLAELASTVEIRPRRATSD